MIQQTGGFDQHTILKKHVGHKPPPIETGTKIDPSCVVRWVLQIYTTL